MSFWDYIQEQFKNLSYQKKINSVNFDIDERLYPPLRERLFNLLEMAHNEGLEVGIFHGYRSYEEQERLFEKGRTKPGQKVTNAAPGFSYHNFGFAADLVFKEDGRWSWAESHPWDRLGALGRACGLEWGGDWERFVDRPHFQWPTKLSLKECREIYSKQKLKGVWDEETKRS